MSRHFSVNEVDESEELLIEIPSKDKPWYSRTLEEISGYNLGDIYTHSFSTTSPPAYVNNKYVVTKKDKKGLWGRLLNSDVREMTEWEV